MSAIDDDVKNKPNIERRELFGLIRTTLCVGAMQSLELEKFLPNCLYSYYVARLVDLFYECVFYCAVGHILGIFMYTFYLGLNDFDLEFLMNCLMQIVIYFWAIIMQLYFRHMKPDALHKIIDLVNLQYRTRSAKGLTYVTMDECLARSKRFIRIFVFSGYSGVVFWLVFPLINQDKSLPLNCQYPFDEKQPLIYEMLFILQSFGQIQVAAAFAASSGLFMVLAVLLSGQYDILFCSLKNIIATAYIEVGATQTDLRQLKELHHLADLEQDQYYVAVEIECDLSELSAGTSCMVQKKYIPTALKRALKDCIAHHRYIIAALKEIENFYSPIWLLKVVEVTFVLCIMAFVTVKTTTGSSFMRTLSLGQYMFLLHWELLMICYFADIIHLNSQRCGEAILRSPWHLHMQDMRSDLLFFLLNSKRHFQFTAGKLSNLNVVLFRSIVTTAFSVFTLLQKMDTRNNKKV